MPKSRSRKSKKTKRVRKTRKSSIHRSPSSKGVHTFTGETSAGQLVIPSGNTTLYQSAVWVIRLPNIPIFATMGINFEFCRLNKFSISYLPKSNMQTNLPFLPSSGVNTQGTSITGTLITAIDQVPIAGVSTLSSTATCWISDATETNVTLAAPYSFTSAAYNQPGVDYVRGIEKGRETELYKKVKQSFYPAFYSSIVDMAQNNPPSTGLCFERRIKKWINCTTITGSSQTSPILNAGPFYWGPMFALCVNQPSYMGSSETFPLFDVRMKYSISFKRVRGQ